MGGSVPPARRSLQLPLASEQGGSRGFEVALSLETVSQSRYSAPRMPPEETPTPWCPKCASARVTLTLRSTNGAYCLCAECGHCWYHQRSADVQARVAVDENVSK